MSTQSSAYARSGKGASPSSYPIAIAATVQLSDGTQFKVRADNRTDAGELVGLVEWLEQMAQG